ncbi:discoidin domain-containing protein [Sphingomicrobium sp. XHP0239]|uniref:discoidin domain-containing protein n=1 Tax=Sphingomicrobium maritimum TaxID=3133972 RepID=UPI0031CC7350
MIVQTMPYPPPAGGTAYRYIRLFFPDGADINVSGRVGLREVEIAATLGGPDQCSADASINLSAAASSSNVTGSYLPRNAFDGITSSGNGWCSGTGAGVNAWIRYDFQTGIGSPAVCSEVRAWQGWTTVCGSPSRIVVQGSDDAATWTTLFESAAGLSWSAGEMKTITA